MSSDKQTDGSSKLSGNGSCLRAGIPESDTGESGEESEPTYRHYDNFETDVCLTQDEDEDPAELSLAVVKDLGKNLQPVGNLKLAKINPTGMDGRDLLQKDINGINRGLSSDSDSCTETESEVTQGQGQAKDDTTTTSTSESEETQIWVPISKRPSTRQIQDTTSDPPPSATSSNGSDHSRPQSYIHKASSPPPGGAGSLSYVTTQMERNNSRAGSHDGVRRDSRDSWHTLQSNLQSSGVNKRVSPSKQVSVGLLRHDEATGTITLDIRNVPNGDSGLGHEDGQYTPSDDTFNTGGANASMLKGRQARTGGQRLGLNMRFTECVCVVCSGLYMLFVVVVGLILPIAEVFVTKPYPALFEGFYIYLYVMSIAFLVYAYSYLLRIRTFSVGRRGRTIVSSVPVQNRKRTACFDDDMTEQTGSFYLRLGAVGFGIGSMIKSGLHFGEYFEMTSSPNCAHVLLGIRPVLHLCFTFIQLYFVFLNSKMLIHRYRYLSRIGLMHMIATNIAVWFEDIVRETIRELGRTSSATDADNSSSLSSSSLRLVEQYEKYGFPHCQGDSLMGEVVEMSSPFLYPCSILYSIICASILFVMWLNLSKKDPKDDRQSGEPVPKERSNVDCSSSSRGLFLGIIIFVAAVIILITFFVLARTDEFMNTAVRLDHLGDVAIFVITTISLILAFHRTHGLRYTEHDDGPGFEDALLVISLLGVYILCVTNIIAGALTDIEHYGHLIILSNCLRCVQATVQTLYLLNTMRKRVWKREQEEAKTGREFVTFLLICNFALWGMNIFEVQRSEANPVQANFYGSVAWNIITHVSVPLAIFYRFHSTVCLANIWKHAWKFRS